MWAGGHRCRRVGATGCCPAPRLSLPAGRIGRHPPPSGPFLLLFPPDSLRTRRAAAPPSPEPAIPIPGEPRRASPPPPTRQGAPPPARNILRMHGPYGWQRLGLVRMRSPPTSRAPGHKPRPPRRRSAARAVAAGQDGGFLCVPGGLRGRAGPAAGSSALRESPRPAARGSGGSGRARPARGVGGPAVRCVGAAGPGRPERSRGRGRCGAGRAAVAMETRGFHPAWG